MKRMGLAVFAVLVLAGCGADSPEKVSDELKTVLNDEAAILDGVTDEASARAAVPRLAAVKDRVVSIGERYKAMGKMDAKAEEKIMGDIVAGMAQVGIKMGQVFTRSPKGAEIVSDSVEAINKAIGELPVGKK